MSLVYIIYHSEVLSNESAVCICLQAGDHKALSLCCASPHSASALPVFKFKAVVVRPLNKHDGMSLLCLIKALSANSLTQSPPERAGASCVFKNVIALCPDAVQYGLLGAKWG